MTTVSDLAQSLEASEPFELFRLSLGGTPFLFTNTEQPITLANGDTYEPSDMGRIDQIVRGPKGRSQTVKFTAARTNPFVASWRSGAPATTASLIMLEGQRQAAPAEAFAAYIADITGVSFRNNGATAVINTQTIEAGGKVQMPLYSFGGPCQHVVYGPGCEVNPSPFTHNLEITAVLPNGTIQIDDAALQIDGYFDRGVLRSTTGEDPRQIVKHVGNIVALRKALPASAAGTTVQLLAGCDHFYLGKCRTLFQNQDRYGGKQWVPNRNLFSTGLR